MLATITIDYYKTSQVLRQLLTRKIILPLDGISVL